MQRKNMKSVFRNIEFVYTHNGETITTTRELFFNFIPEVFFETRISELKNLVSWKEV